MKDIGSEFELERILTKKKSETCISFIPNKKRILLSSGRDSLVYVIRAYNIKKMLVPSYLEGEVINEILKEGVKIRYYRIDENLEVDLDDLQRKSSLADSLLVVHYFGFPQKVNQIRNIAKKNNLITIEDCVQSMLSTYHGKPLGSYSHASFNSLRKFLGIPDGSILTTLEDANVTESKSHKLFIKKRIDALVGKRKYLDGNPKYSRFYFKKAFVEADKILEKYPRPAPMSTISIKMMKKIDFDKIKKIRRRNFEFLLSKLGNIAFYKKLPANVCPLGFPILVKNRDETRKNLIENGIYPPIHWILPPRISKKFKESRVISNNILTIPIDQRYTTIDMKRIVEVLTNFRGI